MTEQLWKDDERGRDPSSERRMMVAECVRLRRQWRTIFQSGRARSNVDLSPPGVDGLGTSLVPLDGKRGPSGGLSSCVNDREFCAVTKLGW